MGQTQTREKDIMTLVSELKNASNRYSCRDAMQELKKRSKNEVIECGAVDHLVNMLNNDFLKEDALDLLIKLTD